MNIYGGVLPLELYPYRHSGAAYLGTHPSALQWNIGFYMRRLLVHPNLTSFLRTLGITVFSDAGVMQAWRPNDYGV